MCTSWGTSGRVKNAYNVREERGNLGRSRRGSVCVRHARLAADQDAQALLLGSRTVFLGNELDDLCAEHVISTLLYLDGKSPNQDIRYEALSLSLSLVDKVQDGVDDVHHHLPPASTITCEQDYSCLIALSLSLYIYECIYSHMQRSVNW